MRRLTPLLLLAACTALAGCGLQPMYQFRFQQIHTHSGFCRQINMRSLIFFFNLSRFLGHINFIMDPDFSDFLRQPI